MKPSLIALAIATMLSAAPALAQNTSTSRTKKSSASTKTANSKPKTLEAVQVTAALDRARNALSPDTGTSQTVFDRKSIQQLPQGDSTPLNQVILQAPGVVQDSFGQLQCAAITPTCSTGSMASSSPRASADSGRRWIRASSIR